MPSMKLFLISLTKGNFPSLETVLLFIMVYKSTVIIYGFLFFPVAKPSACFGNLSVSQGTDIPKIN